MKSAEVEIGYFCETLLALLQAAHFRHAGVNGCSIAWFEAVEENLSVDEDLFRQAIAGERIAVPDNQVRIFTVINRSDVLVYAHDPCSVKRDHAQSFVFGGAAITHSLCGFLVQSTHVVVGVALDRD